jgi:hypothetical protein
MEQKREEKQQNKQSKYSASKSGANGAASTTQLDQQSGPETHKNVNPELRDNYLQVLEDKE